MIVDENTFIMKKIKLIWDFRGPSGQKTAEHHEHHVEEFLQAKNLKAEQTGVETLNAMHSICFLIVEEANLEPIRNALRPHRATWYEPN